MRTLVLIVVALSLQFLAIMPANAQSWSAWKQLAEEQERKAQWTQAESSWRSAYHLIKQSGSRDSRLYISAQNLAQTLVAEKKTEEAGQVLKEVCGDDLSSAGTIPEEQLACLQFYLGLCKDLKDASEVARVESLIDKLPKQSSVSSASAEKQVSLLFGEAAKDDLYKKLGQVRQLIKQKDYTAAERELNQALLIANATRGHEIMSLILREQGKFYCITKDYKKAEIAFRSLSEIVKQDAGPESQYYIEVLGSHARLLHLLGDDKLAAAEQAKCEAISNKFKITPSGQQEPFSVKGFGTNLASSSNNGGTTSVADRLFGRGNNSTQNPPVPVIASATAGNTGPRVNGRLRVIEFFTVW